MRHKANCGVDDTETRLCMEECDVVATWNMTVDPQNHTRWKHKSAQSRVGQESFVRRMEQQKKKDVRVRLTGGLRDFRTDEREALGST